MRNVLTSSWNVRNVGLILFSTIVHRSLAPGRGTQDFFASRSTLATRTTLANWHGRYPSIIPYITRVLEELSTAGTASAHSPLFPILIIVRSLRWSSNGSALAEELFQIVKTYLGSSEWQVRTVAAQALSSLVSPDQALQQVYGGCGIDTIGLNVRHGELLYLRHLVSEVIDWDVVDESQRRRIEGVLLDQMSRYRSDQPLIAKATMDLLAAYLESVRSPSGSIRDRAVDLAKMTVQTSAYCPGSSLLVASSGHVLRSFGGEEALPSLISSADDDLTIPTLEHLIDASHATKLGLLRSLINVVIESKNTFARIAALEVIVSLPASDQTLRVATDAHIVRLVAVLEQLLGSSKSVPLKEAALAGLGWAIGLVSLSFAHMTNGV